MSVKEDGECEEVEFDLESEERRILIAAENMADRLEEDGATRRASKKKDEIDAYVRDFRELHTLISTKPKKWKTKTRRTIVGMHDSRRKRRVFNTKSNITTMDMKIFLGYANSYILESIKNKK